MLSMSSCECVEEFVCPPAGVGVDVDPDAGASELPVPGNVVDEVEADGAGFVTDAAVGSFAGIGFPCLQHSRYQQQSTGGKALDSHVDFWRFLLEILRQFVF